jgi:TRIAD3 protein (E3 ubiquitin-protein ligase RNF216)
MRAEPDDAMPRPWRAAGDRIPVAPHFQFAGHPFDPDFFMARWGNFNDLEIDPLAAIERSERREELQDLRPAPDRLAVCGVECLFPLVSGAFHTALKEALATTPSLNVHRVSLFLRAPVRDNAVPADLRRRIIIAGTDTRSPESRLLTEQATAFVSTVFNIKPAPLSRVLIECHFLVTDAVKILRDRGTPQRPNARETLHVTDAVVAVCLSALWEQEEGARREAAEAARRREQYEEAQRNHDLFECGCCCESVLFSDLVQCPEGHLFCQSCVRRQIETAIGEGRVDVPCLAIGGCAEQIPLAELERAMPPSVVRRLIQTETLNAIASADLPGLVKCHGCGLPWVFEGADAVVVCRECHAQTCRLCGRGAHAGRTCEEIAAIDGDRLIEEQMNEAVVRTCPHCRTQFMKEDGCNKMECPRCHTWICYFCRKIIPKETGYAHFWQEPGPCPPDRCPLWVSNEALHALEAEDARAGARPP